MSMCEQLAANASAGVAPALRAVDCLTNQTTAAAFGRLFGGNGALLPALTILLTLYIAFFAISLLTGRSRLGVSALIPRMMTLGLVLTFATSWIAYQSVVWNLATGAPDQVASILTGSRGPATKIFADHIDVVFNAIAEVADQAGAERGQGAGPVAQENTTQENAPQSAPAQGSAQAKFTPGDVMWFGAILLLLGTVGVLVTARIALAVLLALGPIFVVFALFSGTRGLFVGWLRAAVMTSLTPMFVVLGGSFVMELLVPVVANLGSVAGGVDGRAALALFMLASIHVALMGMVLKVGGSIVSAWEIFGLARGKDEDTAQATRVSALVLPSVEAHAGMSRQPVRLGGLAAVSIAATADVGSPAGGSSGGHSRTIITQMSDGPAFSPAAGLPRQRARGVGSRFRAPPTRMKEIAR